MIQRPDWHARRLILAASIFAGAAALHSQGAPLAQSEYLNSALRQEGDASRGRALFQDEQRIACSKCHTLDGSSGKAGPDLFAVGDKFGRRELIESVLWPSASIETGYHTTTLVTKSGDEYAGIIKQAAPHEIELMNAGAERQRVPVADIAERRTSEVSLMPEGLEVGLSVGEFTDLIEFLVSLKQTQSKAMLENGMPGQIEPIPRPVTVRPFPRENLHFEHPVWFGSVPGESNAFLIVEHETGVIWRLEKRSDDDSKTPFVSLGVYQTGTRGLLGIAFHPDYAGNGKYYFARHVVENGNFSTLICERQAAPDRKADSGIPSRIVLQLPEATNVHYGGGLQFGPDGCLYVGIGDSGPQEDPQGHAQDSGRLLGKMLRIDVDHYDASHAYSVPPDNPFVGRTEFLPEIWAWGFREPWRFSFDPLNGDLWVGDVGQDRYEEVDIVRRGENYGWNVYEGFEPFSNRYRRPDAHYAQPVFAYARKFGVSVTGGYVYRANRRSSFYGVYIFGDYESRRIFGLTQDAGRLLSVRQIGSAPQRIVSFGRDHLGELYLVGYEGSIYRLDLDQSVFP